MLTGVVKRHDTVNQVCIHSDRFRAFIMYTFIQWLYLEVVFYGFGTKELFWSHC